NKDINILSSSYLRTEDSLLGLNPDFSRTMRANLCIAAFSLLGAVILCRAQSSGTPETITGSTPAPGTQTGTSTTASTGESSTASTTPTTASTGESSTASTGTLTTASTGESSTASTGTPTTAKTEKPTVEPPSGGLSGGAIAGITIGTIAGVGLLGGGVYGLLKYTNII
ncbi:hypothetical protein ATANTOWER_027068, partial [Ataeniobius toweri]|nr:hypothetical protein [Ataeniobius toweri]